MLGRLQLQIKPILYAVLFHVSLLILFVLALFYVDPQYRPIVLNSLSDSLGWFLLMLVSIVFSIFWLSLLGVVVFIVGVIKRISITKIVISSAIFLFLPYFMMAFDESLLRLSAGNIVGLIFFLTCFPLGFYLALVIGKYEAK